MQSKEKEIRKGLDMVESIMQRYGDVFADSFQEITMSELNYYWGGSTYCTYNKKVRIRIFVGFESRHNIIYTSTGINILFENKWESLGLFVKKISTYNEINKDFNEESVVNNINILIDLINETAELKPIYLDDKE